MAGMHEYPIIRLEIEQMRHSIAAMLSKHTLEMDAKIQQALKVACDNFDYRGEVLRIANDCIRGAIKNAIEEQFRYGGAGYEAVQVVAKQLAENALKSIAAK